MNKEGILKKLRENREKIKAFGVKRIVVFGSFVRDTASEKSDVDVVVAKQHLRTSAGLLISLRNFLVEKLTS